MFPGPMMDFNWKPTTRGGDGSNRFFLYRQGLIVDKKLLPSDARLTALAAPKIMYTIHQYIRISIVDPCNNLMAPIKLGLGYDLTIVKDSQDQQGGTYTIDHSEVNPQ